jgi:hypothetical protein
MHLTPSGERVMLRAITSSLGIGNIPRTASHQERNAPRLQDTDTVAPAASASAPESPAAAASSAPRMAGMRNRARQILNTKFLPHEPALRYGPDNDSAWPQVAEAICNDWLRNDSDRKKCLTSQESFIDTSRMMALLYEYKHRANLAQGSEELLLSGIKKPRWFRPVREPHLLRAAYHKEIILAFLRAVGEEDPEAVLKSFKRTGTGALHRQHVVAGSTLTNALGAAQLIVPDPIAKLVLSAVRTVSLLLTSIAVAASGERRLHNAGTEDVFPLGRADAAPAARHAPNVLQASWSAATKLGGLDKDVQELTALLTELTQPATEPRRENSDSAAAAQQSTQRLDRLLLLSARISHRLHIMEKYRNASENAKVEWQGNKYNLMTGGIGTLSTLTASGVSILAPVMITGVAAGAGLAGATLAAVLAYVAYQLSDGPEKDGEAKAKRAIIALAKLSAVIDPGAREETLQQVQAYETYLQALNKKDVDNESEEVKLLNRLRGIAHAALAASKDAAEDTQSSTPAAPTDAGASEPVLPDAINWHSYREYHQAKKQIENDPENQVQQAEALVELNRQFFDAHASTLANQPLIDGWKKPLPIRMNAAGRIAAGQTASSMKQCIELHRSLMQDAPRQSSEAGRLTFSTPQSIHRLMENRHVKQRTRQDVKLKAAQDDLKRHLKDMVYFALAQHLLKDAANAKQPGQEPDQQPPQLALAKAALARVNDSSMHMLFCGDGMQQVKAMLASKTQMGDAERYTWLNTGANAATTLLATGVQFADLQIIADKADGRYSGPTFNDYKLVNHMQAGATPSAPLSTGDRTAIQEREIDPLRALITPKDGSLDEHPALTMILPVFNTAEMNDETEAGKTEFDTQLDEQADRIVDAMEGRTFIPRTLHLQFGVQAQAEAGPSNSTPLPPEISIDISLDRSKALHDMYFAQAKKKDKARYVAGVVGLGAKQSAAVIAGLPVQAGAQFFLRQSRDARSAARKNVRDASTLLQKRKPGSELPASGAPESLPTPPAASAGRQGQHSFLPAINVSSTFLEEFSAALQNATGKED